MHQKRIKAWLVKHDRYDEEFKKNTVELLKRIHVCTCFKT
ncbi:hypothetical protein LEP1GSC081_2632 [Leptospira kirschneri str. H1]|uniref:Uncharacterized protein n=1 Tax=Leptospira kirschneri str. H1 TaxID=1049966 RepID=A0A0E2B787_9LEPT|nr:hypothetical protein LEP1GSC081_2632 [Leptospira kirschneri str. H1]